MLSLSDTEIIFYDQMKKTALIRRTHTQNQKPIQKNDILTLEHVVREGSKESILIL